MFSFEYFLTSFFNKVLNNVTVATCIGAAVTSCDMCISSGEAINWW